MLGYSEYITSAGFVFGKLNIRISFPFDFETVPPNNHACWEKKYAPPPVRLLP